MSEKIAPAAAAAPVAIAVPIDAIDAVRGSLSPKNSVGVASVDFYVAALAAAGVSDPDSLSFAESVEVTRRLYAASADYRRAVADDTKAAKDAERAVAKAKRDAERAERAKAEIERIRAKLAKLESGA